MKRELEIIKLLLQSNRFLTIDELSEVFGVSKRTIRNDLALVEETLGITKARLVRNRKHGVLIDRGDMPEAELKDFYTKIIGDYDYYSADERKNIILQTLLSSESCSIKALMDATKSGRTTVTRDLAACERWLGARNIFIERKPRYGIRLVYEEFDWRKAVLKHIVKHFTKADFLKLYTGYKNNKLLTFNQTINKFANRFVKDSNPIAIRNFIGKYESDWKIQFSDDAFNNILFYICISISRIRWGREIIRGNHKTQQSQFIDEQQVAWMGENISMLNAASPIVFNKEEASMLLRYILSAGKVFSGGQGESTGEKEKELVKEFIHGVEEFLSIELLQDEALFNNLLMHIRPTIHRILFDMEIQNPLKQEIKCLYPQIFKACEIASECFYRKLGKRPGEDEIGYLAMHVGASVEMIKQDKAKRHFYKAIVVCSSGVGASQMLYSRLLTEFPNLIIERTSSVDDLHSANKQDIDMIISTVPLPIGTQESVIYVSPLLKKQDIEQIRKYMRRASLISKDANRFIVDDLMAIIVQQCDVPNYRRLESSLVQYFSREDKRRKELPPLMDFVKAEHICLQADAGDWEESIEAAGILLYNSGHVEEVYIDRMIEAKAAYGDSIVVAPGVALPHAKTCDGVKTAGIAFVTLKTPVAFGNSEYDPVKLVIALAADEGMSHLRALYELVALMEDQAMLDNLFQCDNVDQFIQILGTFSKKIEEDAT